jgi:signal transduction histidine kinase
VSSHWRIRHKLMLGLGLVVVVMSLLLGGTLYGLWSNYVTMNSIRYKTAELVAAGNLKAAIARLLSPSSIRNLSDHPDGIDAALAAVRDKLNEYEHSLQESLSHGLDPTSAAFEHGHLELLKEHLDGAGFSKAVEELFPPQATVKSSADEDQRVAAAVGESDFFAKLTRSSQDLWDGINQELGYRIDGSRRHYQVALWIIVPASVFGLLCVAGMMRSFYAWVFNPIRDLESGVKRVAEGDFDHRIELHSGDEMEDLSVAFNDMMGRLQELYADLARQVNERSRQLVRSERLASVGFLAAGVAHEINNPLASIAFCSEALEARLGDLLRQVRPAGRGDDPEVFTKYLKMIQEEAFRCKNITERLLKFSRTGERRREQTDLGQLVQSVLDITQHLQNSRGKEIAFEVSADRAPGGRVLAWVNGEEIKSVVLNLVVNALDSMDEGGRLTIRLTQREGMAELRFTDTGCGMAPEVLENIFEPFFTRSRTGKGTGLGLTISYQIVSQHGGELEAVSDGPGQGSTFTVRLPLQAVEANPAEAARRPRGRAA